VGDEENGESYEEVGRTKLKEKAREVVGGRETGRVGWWRWGGAMGLKRQEKDPSCEKEGSRE